MKFSYKIISSLDISMRFKFLILLVFIYTPFSLAHAFQNEPSEIFGMSFYDSEEDLYKLFPGAIKVNKAESGMDHFKISDLKFLGLDTKPTMVTFIDNKLFSILIEFNSKTNYISAGIPKDVMSYVDSNISKTVIDKEKQQRIKLKSILMYLLENKYGESKLLKDKKGVYMQWVGSDATLVLHLEESTLLIVSSKIFQKISKKYGVNFN